VNQRHVPSNGAKWTFDGLRSGMRTLTVQTSSTVVVRPSVSQSHGAGPLDDLTLQVVSGFGPKPLTWARHSSSLYRSRTSGCRRSKRYAVSPVWIAASSSAANSSAVGGSSAGVADGGGVGGGSFGGIVGVAGLGLAVGAVVGGADGGGLAVARPLAPGLGVGTAATGVPARERPISAPAPTLRTNTTASTTPYWIQRVRFKAAPPPTERAPMNPTRQSALQSRNPGRLLGPGLRVAGSRSRRRASSPFRRRGYGRRRSGPSSRACQSPGSPS
jgi:hypothetical protein